MRYVVTGGAGFIGSNFLNHMVKKYPQAQFVNVDLLTYAGNLENLEVKDSPNYSLIKADIRDKQAMTKIIKKDDIVINFAAESHVDNSLNDADPFITTNILGVQAIIEVCRLNEAKLLVQISTDEVYGSKDFKEASSKETDRLDPSSPYSASKAAAELLCKAAIRSFNQPIIITRSSNNFGPYHYPEKVIPLFITNLLENKKVPLYGDGKNIRDWIYVKDNCEAIDFIIHHGKVGEEYNIGGGNELSNKQLTLKILEVLSKDESYISYVEDRKGHDLRYSLDCSKLHKLGWKPNHTFEESLKSTIEWYKSNRSWWEPLKAKTKRVS